MAKKKEKSESKENLFLLAIVAIVAVVGIVVLILNYSGSTVSLLDSDLSGEAYAGALNSADIGGIEGVGTSSIEGVDSVKCKYGCCVGTVDRCTKCKNSDGSCD